MNDFDYDIVQKKRVARGAFAHVNRKRGKCRLPSDYLTAAHESTMTVTAYCPCEKCCGAYSNGYTATGAKATQGVTIATDPDVIPLGTEVEIDGHIYIAQDVGGAVSGNRIDLYFDSHDDALQWGVQEKTARWNG